METTEEGIFQVERRAGGKERERKELEVERKIKDKSSLSVLVPK